MNWTNMDIFEGIDLNDSFVLNWSSDAKIIEFEIEASIWPGSKYYSHPKENEYTCYKKATLKFTDYDTISGLLNMNDVKPFSDANNEKDFGNIDSLSETQDGFELSGEFGGVVIVGGKVVFEIYT